MNITRQKPIAALTITTAGFAVTVAQILLVRELLVLFSGNEMSAGIIFVFWLLWTAVGTWLGQMAFTGISRHTAVLIGLICLIAWLLPLDILFIRAGREIWHISAGEIPPLGKMVWIALTSTGVICPVSGMMFVACWMYSQAGILPVRERQPLGIYMGESLGAAMAGLFFYFFLLPHFSALISASITSFGLVMVATVIVLLCANDEKGLGFVFLATIFLTIVLCIELFFNTSVESISRKWQWHRSPQGVHDTPYQNIAVFKHKGQMSVYSNGTWLFSMPDLLTNERDVHLALLQHDDPKSILLISGGLSGQIGQLLKYPHIEHIDYVEADPDFVRYVRNYLDSHDLRVLKNKKVSIRFQDANLFLQHQKQLYDVILMNMGDPINAQVNRFYTREFFTSVAQHLNPDGIFSFAVSGGEDMLGRAQAGFLAAIYNTLSQVFPHILIYPGDQVRLVAAFKPRELTVDADVLAKRIRENNLALDYIREDTLWDIVNPFRQEYIKNILEEFKSAKVNQDFAPICYRHYLSMWVTAWHPDWLNKLDDVLSIPLTYFIWGVFGIGLFMILAFYGLRLDLKQSVGCTIWVGGAFGIVIQLVLLLAFQFLQGDMYLQLALIISAFMAGLTAGTFLVSNLARYRMNANTYGVWFRRLQAIMVAAPLVLLGILLWIHSPYERTLPSALISSLFFGLSFLAGVLGGSQFSLGTYVLSQTDIPLQKIGGFLYARDLAGACLGVFVVSFFVFPVYGLTTTLYMMSFFALVCYILLLRHR